MTQPSNITQKKIQFYYTQFDHVKTQLTFGFWFFLVIIAKIAFQRFEKVKKILPDSALLLVLGCIFGFIFPLFFESPEKIHLEPDWFFLYFLPPIALDAGYFMPNKDFFQNIGTITTYAVIGTLFNIITIGLTLFFFKDYINGSPSLIELLIFASLISAVDPVAVICVFEEVHVNQVLFICVFGESLLNDAVSIVVYKTLNSILKVGSDNIFWYDFIHALISFFYVSFGGIIVGIIWAILTGIVTKLAVDVNVVQPLTCLLFPYLAYLCAESFGLSGILAIVVCGMLMKQYVVGNISDLSKVTVDYFMKTLSSSCESVIFVLLGISSVSNKLKCDWLFITITLGACLIYRFIGVGILTYFLNLKRLQKINFVDQFIMGYGGIRGAVCYGLVMSLEFNYVPNFDVFATTTVIVIIFTVFIQGGSIKKLVEYLKVKQHQVYKKSVFEMISDNVINHVTGGCESIAGLHGDYWMRMVIERFNDTYIKPYIMIKNEAKAMKIVKHNEEIQVGEAVTYLKQHGSFAGMPTVQSKVDLCQDNSHSVSFNDFNTLYTNNVSSISNGRLLTEKKMLLNPNQLNRLKDESNSNYDSFRRNWSITGFVQQKLNEMNSPVHTYSRHFLHDDQRPSLFPLVNDEDSAKDDLVADNNCYKTYPYSKSSQKDLFILNVRKASRTNTSGVCSSSTCAYGCHNCNSNNQPTIFTAAPYTTNSSKDFVKVKPKFMITSDVGDFDDTTGQSPSDCSTNNVFYGTTYSIGRFEVGSESGTGTPVPLRKLSGGLPVRNRLGSDEISIRLLTIDEQDEQHLQTPK